MASTAPLNDKLSQTTVNSNEEKSKDGSNKDKSNGNVNVAKTAVTCQCECKSIKFTISKLPNQVQLCYCTMCQRMHGSICGAWCPIRENSLKWIENTTLTNYQSSKRVIRSFCNKCGSNISLKYLYQNNLIWMCPSVFENQQWFNKENAKILHIHCESKTPWFTLPNDGFKRLTSGSG